MKLESLFGPDHLAKHIREKTVRAQQHPSLPLTILNYTQKAQFGRVWDEVTTQCRGLVYETTTGEVLARPWPKFFQLGTSYRPETMLENLPVGNPEVTTKLDGFLLIAVPWDGSIVWASRGSFVSDHAKWAQAFWAGRFAGHASWHTAAIEHTLLFEGLCKDLRIVVKYPQDDIVLLSMVDKTDGHELPNSIVRGWGAALDTSVVSVCWKTIGQLEQEMKTDKVGEGYVLSWLYHDRPSLKIKMKAEEYLRLHRLLTGVSPRHVWECMRTGASLTSILEGTPNDFRQWVEGWAARLGWEYAAIDARIREALAKAVYLESREAQLSSPVLLETATYGFQTLYFCLVKADRARKAAFAKFVKQCAAGNKQIEAGVFARAFSTPKAYNDWLWKQAEPAGAEPFRMEDK